VTDNLNILLFFKKKDGNMTEEIDELLGGDDVDLVYGNEWYFKMAEKYLSRSSGRESAPLSINPKANRILHTSHLKDAS